MSDSDILQLPCPGCDALNRVPRARLQEQPVCGRCQRPLIGRPVELDTTRFDRYLARCPLPIVVDFWAPWCAPCVQMAPHFAEAARLLSDHAVLAKVDTEAEPDLGARFGIRSIPTMALFVAGEERLRVGGARGARDIVAWVQQAMASSAS